MKDHYTKTLLRNSDDDNSIRLTCTWVLYPVNFCITGDSRSK